MDEHLSWKHHTTELCKKLSKITTIFYVVCLYNSLFLTFLYYGLIAWDLTYNAYLTPLFRIQKKILRCIKFQPSVTPSAPLFHTLKIMKLEDMLHLSILSFVYKAIDKLSPICFHCYFTPDSLIHRFGTRQATRDDLYIALKRTSLYGPKTVQYFGSKLWNTLPFFIRIASSITVFRSKLTAYDIDSYV